MHYDYLDYCQQKNIFTKDPLQPVAIHLKIKRKQLYKKESL